MAVIDAGLSCINRQYFQDGSSTYLIVDNPSNADGTIDTVCYYSTGSPASTIKFGVFEHVSGDDFVCRGNTGPSSISMSGSSPGARTATSAGGDFTAFPVSTGDLAGIYFVFGFIARDTGYSGWKRLYSDGIGTDEQNTFSSLASHGLSLFFTGETTEPEILKLSGSTTESSTVIIINENDWTTETVVSGIVGNFEISPVVSGTKTVLAKKSVDA